MAIATSQNTYITMKAPTVVTVGVASTKVLDPNPNRKVVILVNTSDEDISLAFENATAVLGSGVVLKAAGANSAGSLFLTPDDVRTIGQINAICTSGSKSLAVQEGE